VSEHAADERAVAIAGRGGETRRLQSAEHFVDFLRREPVVPDVADALVEFPEPNLVGRDGERRETDRLLPDRVVGKPLERPHSLLARRDILPTLHFALSDLEHFERGFEPADFFFSAYSVLVEE
jgi:hypothetical protein